MNVARSRDRIRTASPLTFRQSQQIRLKGGFLKLHNVNTTNEVSPTGTVDVNFVVSNGNIDIKAQDPDCCGPVCNDLFPGDSPFNGYLYRVVVELAGERRSTGNHCIQTTELGTVDKPWGVSIPAPAQTGSHTITITMELPGSGTEETISREVAVVGDGDPRPGPDECQADGECPTGWTCQDGSCVPSSGGGGGGGGPVLPCFIDPNRACNLPEAAGWTTLAGLLIAGVIYSGS